MNTATYTGRDLLNEVYDLMCHRLPLLAVDDLLRPRVLSLLPVLGAALGRPRVSVVGDDR